MVNKRSFLDKSALKDFHRMPVLKSTLLADIGVLGLFVCSDFLMNVQFCEVFSYSKDLEVLFAIEGGKFWGELFNFFRP